jgi:hypothetical protein
MGFRFRKTITVVPGVRLNLSKTGASVSVGEDGATLNIGRRGARSTLGLPGSGLSYSETVRYADRKTLSRGGFARFLKPSAGGVAMVAVVAILVIRAFLRGHGH